MPARAAITSAPAATAGATAGNRARIFPERAFQKNARQKSARRFCYRSWLVARALLLAPGGEQAAQDDLRARRQHMQAGAALAQIDHILQHQHGQAMHRRPHRQAQRLDRAARRRFRCRWRRPSGPGRETGRGWEAGRRTSAAPAPDAGRQSAYRRRRYWRCVSDSSPGALAASAMDLAQFVEAFDGQFDQQRFVIGEMPIGRGMADAGPARHGPQGQGRERFFFQDGARRLQQRRCANRRDDSHARPCPRYCRSVAEASRSLFMT